MEDQGIRDTDADAAGARISAVKHGYLTDPYASMLTPRSHLHLSRPPLINIGTYLRTTAIDALVFRWLDLAASEGKKCQILSFGAGSDTRFWRIQDSQRASVLSHYWEFDFVEIATKKAMSIKKNKTLSAPLGDISLSHGGAALHSPTYQLIPLDLRSPPGEALPPILTPENATLSTPNLSPDVPTLLLFECVLAYMNPAESESLIKWFIDYFAAERAPLGSIVYEMFQLDDSFGRVMLKNMKARNITLPGAMPYQTKGSLPTRFTNQGFSWAKAVDLQDIRVHYIEPHELHRISTLELLDEIEEMDLLLRHYAITWGALQPASVSSAWDQWGLEKAAPQTDEGEENDNDD